MDDVQDIRRYIRELVLEVEQRPRPEGPLPDYTAGYLDALEYLDEYLEEEYGE